MFHLRGIVSQAVQVHDWTVPNDLEPNGRSYNLAAWRTKLEKTCEQKKGIQADFMPKPTNPPHVSS